MFLILNQYLVCLLSLFFETDLLIWFSELALTVHQSRVRILILSQSTLEHVNSYQMSSNNKL